jgi:parallel beta-helix repeat protein
MKRMKRGTVVLAAAVVAVAVLPATGAAETIKVETTIADAIAQASDGDTIVVPPGTYHEGSLVVTQDDLTIRGSKSAVLDASGNSIGIRVGADRITGDPPQCPAFTVDDFTLKGLTIRDASFTGIFLIGVDGFRVTGGRYIDNEEYGVFPRCTRDGLIDHNFGDGGVETGETGLDATVYVGVDDGITVRNNKLVGGTIGIELENTTDSIVRNNKLTRNVNGILVVVLPGLPTTSTEDALIERNVINSNNVPNPFPLPPPLFDELQLLPAGSGILNVGGDAVTMRRNVVNKNDSFGIGIVENPFGFGPPDDNVVVDNTVKNNAGDPDVRATLSADIAYDGSGTNNCFAGNVFDTDDPDGIVEAFPC